MMMKNGAKPKKFMLLFFPSLYKIIWYRSIMVYLWVTMGYTSLQCAYLYEHVCVRYMFHMKGHTKVDPALWHDRAEVLSREG